MRLTRSLDKLAVRMGSFRCPFSFYRNKKALIVIGMPNGYNNKINS